MSDTVIKVENLAKYYKLGQFNNNTFFRDLQSWLAVKIGKEDPNSKIGDGIKSGEGFWALKDINFEIKQGDRVGIIGKNGAGKSTLLKLISQITTPTLGKIYMKGRVASLLEVGTGFHPEMTGRENIYLNGAIMGMSRNEINQKINDIIDFSEIGEHIDTPVKRYSSGMYVRLGFAVAANLESDILIADEVLAVGDAEFQKKAIGKMSDISTEDGRTVLFVSHQMNAVKSLCKTGIVLDGGMISKQGEIDNCISFYQKNLFSPNRSADFQTYQNEFFDLLNFDVVNEKNEPVTNAVSNDEVNYVLISFDMKKIHTAFTIGYAIYDYLGTAIYWANITDQFYEKDYFHLGKNSIKGVIPSHFMNEGTYHIRMMASIHFQEWLVNPDMSSPSVEYSIQGGLSDSPFWTLKRPGICAPIIKWERLE